MTTAAKKDTERFARHLARLGFTVVRRKHIKVYDEAGHLLVTAARTPSDFRAVKNFQKRMEPHLRALERRQAEMPYVSPKATARNDEVREQVVEVLGRGYNTMQFAHYVVSVAEKGNLKGYKNVESARNSIDRFTRHGQKLSTWAIELMEEALRGLNGGRLPAEILERADSPELPVPDESIDKDEGPEPIERADKSGGPDPDESTDKFEEPRPFGGGLLMGAQQDYPTPMSEHEMSEPDTPLLDLSVDLSLRCLAAMQEGTDVGTALKLAMEIRQLETIIKR